MTHPARLKYERDRFAAKQALRQKQHEDLVKAKEDEEVDYLITHNMHIRQELEGKTKRIDPNDLRFVKQYQSRVQNYERRRNASDSPDQEGKRPQFEFKP